MNRNFIYIQATEIWKLNNEQRIQKAELLKVKGTNYFKKANYKLAMKMYANCLSIVDGISKFSFH